MGRTVPQDHSRPGFGASARVDDEIQKLARERDELKVRVRSLERMARAATRLLSYADSRDKE
jgi:hypothetical protein